MNDGPEGCLAVCVVAAIVVALVFAGSCGADSKWERMIVDDPAQVERIKVRVIAERAEESGG